VIVEYKTYFSSELGLIEIRGSERGITVVEFVEESGDGVGETKEPGIPACLRDCVEQLAEYFEGKRREFSLKLNPRGTDFQERVWGELQKIPYGQTVSYGDIARAVGNPAAVRAVGGANGRNHIVIIIPCHRVIGSDGSLTGFGAGLWRKEWLLNHERME
jgi:methylated-DNA-[protein]-cysteine S-methyltransferase